MMTRGARGRTLPYLTSGMNARRRKSRSLRIEHEDDNLLKFTPVVDNDTTLHGVHTDTVAFSPSVLIKCSICSCHQSLMRTTHEWLKKTIHGSQTIQFYHHGSVTLVDVACLVTWRSGAQSFVIVARFSLWWWTAGLVSLAKKTPGGR